ncbi:MAG TPA: D-alanyl-D-alanine dipeptidase [Anaeromyxobacteraceae bacterium]|nr:D-alanyl-D-alanine dipeptidase [Anaeromyxobacteraceae bacterium]
MTSLLAAAVLSAAATSGPVLVDVGRVIPDAVLDMRYATADNFLHRRVYATARCLLRRDVADRLARVASRLRDDGFRLRLWDCYRPRSVQWQMWRIVPDRRYVADPRRGSNHNRGAAVDLSLATAEGRAVEMPTGFDAFEKRAAADAEEGVSDAARRNRARLRRAMEAEGFQVTPTEWWHFNAPRASRYPLLDQPLDEVAR